MVTFNRAIFPLALVGYEMIIANFALHTTLDIFILHPMRACGISPLFQPFEVCSFSSFAVSFVSNQKQIVRLIVLAVLLQPVYIAPRKMNLIIFSLVQFFNSACGG